MQIDWKKEIDKVLERGDDREVLDVLIKASGEIWSHSKDSDGKWVNNLYLISREIPKVASPDKKFIELIVKIIKQVGGYTAGGKLIKSLENLGNKEKSIQIAEKLVNENDELIAKYAGIMLSKWIEEPRLIERHDDLFWKIAITNAVQFGLIHNILQNRRFAFDVFKNSLERDNKTLKELSIYGLMLLYPYKEFKDEVRNIVTPLLRDINYRRVILWAIESVKIDPDFEMEIFKSLLETEKKIHKDYIKKPEGALISEILSIALEKSTNKKELCKILVHFIINNPKVIVGNYYANEILKRNKDLVGTELKNKVTYNNEETLLQQRLGRLLYSSYNDKIEEGLQLLEKIIQEDLLNRLEITHTVTEVFHKLNEDYNKLENEYKKLIKEGKLCKKKKELKSQDHLQALYKLEQILEQVLDRGISNKEEEYLNTISVGEKDRIMQKREKIIKLIESIERVEMLKNMGITSLNRTLIKKTILKTLIDMDLDQIKEVIDIDTITNSIHHPLSRSLIGIPTDEEIKKVKEDLKKETNPWARWGISIKFNRMVYKAIFPRYLNTLLAQFRTKYEIKKDRINNYKDINEFWSVLSELEVFSKLRYIDENILYQKESNIGNKPDFQITIGNEKIDVEVITDTGGNEMEFQSVGTLKNRFVGRIISEIEKHFGNINQEEYRNKLVVIVDKTFGIRDKEEIEEALLGQLAVFFDRDEPYDTEVGRRDNAVSKKKEIMKLLAGVFWYKRKLDQDFNLDVGFVPNKTVENRKLSEDIIKKIKNSL